MGEPSAAELEHLCHAIRLSDAARRQTLNCCHLLDEVRFWSGLWG